ncbi:MAG: polyphosphate:AMP phosphotransferase, partial [Gammaproteobacteria bacterium]|nr:polyphosphate:AMP phosphotransferase [Gammaproteobacteria bacterium]
KFPVIVVFAGVDGAGKHETVNVLNEWLDPRWLLTNAYDRPSEEEAQRPKWWRYWRDLPPAGQIGLFLSSWYSQPLVDKVHYRSNDQAFADQLEDINRFEQTLVDNGALILKFWMHLDKGAQRKRFERLEKDEQQRWQLRDTDWVNWARYDRFQEAAVELMGSTSAPGREWTLVDGYEKRHRSVTVANAIAEAINARMSVEPPRPAAEYQQGRGQFAALDMTQTIEKKAYEARLAELQSELAVLSRRAEAKGISTTLVFEGWDAAGKGGAIRRLIHPLEAKNYQVTPIAAPTQEELAQHYLWRFWRHVPRDGKVTIFDRSWYGRALVERVEGFCSEADWQRSFHEINEFEQALCDHGGVLCKFWLHITPEEQLQRFKDREQTPYKAWKLTDEDWRNREKWDEYVQAAEDIFANCSPHTAPWTLVEANQKNFARLKVLETVCQRLRKALDD